MTTLEKLKDDYAKYGCRCVKEKGNKKELRKFEKFYFMVDDYTTVLESGYYRLAGDHERKHLSYYLKFTQRKADLKKISNGGKGLTHPRHMP